MKTRVAIAGLGGVAERIHIPACRAIPEIEIAAACDPDEGRRQKMGARFGLKQTFGTCQEMLATVKPEIVLIGAPPDSHHELAEMALQSGAHVLCEKPFMTNLWHADRLIDL